MVDDVRRSVLAKAAEIGELRAQTLTENAERARPTRRRRCARASSAAASCWRWATAARPPTRWTSSPTSARPAGPAIDLTEDPAILTAIANDIGTEAIFSRQVIAYGAAGDALLALSTSGQLAQRDRRAGRGAAAGAGDASRWSATTAGRIAAEGLADHVVVTRSEHIPRIQEAQASAYHVLRELVG